MNEIQADLTNESYYCKGLQFMFVIQVQIPLYLF